MTNTKKQTKKQTIKQQRGYRYTLTSRGIKKSNKSKKRRIARL